MIKDKTVFKKGPWSMFHFCAKNSRPLIFHVSALINIPIDDNCFEFQSYIGLYGLSLM